MLEEEIKAKETCRQQGKVAVMEKFWRSCSKLWEWGQLPEKTPCAGTLE